MGGSDVLMVLLVVNEERSRDRGADRTLGCDVRKLDDEEDVPGDVGLGTLVCGVDMIVGMTGVGVGVGDGVGMIGTGACG